MLDKALILIAARLNDFIHKRVDLDESIVEVASPVSPDGVMPVEANDKVLLFVANISKDTLTKAQHYKTVQSGSVRHREPLHLNLYIYIAANFHPARYSEALYFLSLAIQCLQECPIIDRSVVADMPKGLDKLVLDIENTDLNEVSNLWGILGGKYLPSVFYKVRMLTLQTEGVVSRIHPASTPQPSLSN